MIVTFSGLEVIAQQGLWDQAATLRLAALAPSLWFFISLFLSILVHL